MIDEDNKNPKKQKIDIIPSINFSEMKLDLPKRAQLVNFDEGSLLSLDDLVFHLTKECPNVKIQCNSCKDFYKRRDFVEHPCYLAAQQLDNDILV